MNQLLLWREVVTDFVKNYKKVTATLFAVAGTVFHIPERPVFSSMTRFLHPIISTHYLANTSGDQVAVMCNQICEVHAEQFGSAVTGHACVCFIDIEDVPRFFEDPETKT